MTVAAMSAPRKSARPFVAMCSKICFRVETQYIIRSLAGVVGTVVAVAAGVCSHRHALALAATAA